VRGDRGDIVGSVTDYGRPVEFGVFPVPEAARYHDVLADVRYADRAGLEVAGIQDHPYQRRFLDTFSLITDLAARTSRLRFFPDVACLPLRPPAMLAKQAASIDLRSGGRFELGLGAGAFWDAIEAMGGPRRTPRDAVDAVEEAITVLRLCWSEQRAVRFDGAHYRLAGLHPGPRPAHDIGIWIGGGGPRMLSLIGRLADGWVPSSSWLGPAAAQERAGRIDEAALAAGRSPADIRRVYNVNGQITDGPSRGFLDGPPGQWVDQLTHLAIEVGMDTFVFWAGDADPSTQLRRYAEEVAPAVREAVTKARNSS
jgi:alkanesulfonate monooxygenase SsuD/methylene tetrahydromethanopterin reductase-like flavin-dependent oxidoreductase (luciferase family)